MAVEASVMEELEAEEETKGEEQEEEEEDVALVVVAAGRSGRHMLAPAHGSASHVCRQDDSLPSESPRTDFPGQPETLMILHTHSHEFRRGQCLQVLGPSLVRPRL